MPDPDVIHLPLSAFVKAERLPPEATEGAPYHYELYGLFLTDSAQQLHEQLSAVTKYGLRPVWLEKTDLLVLRQTLNEILGVPNIRDLSSVQSDSTILSSHPETV